MKKVYLDYASLTPIDKRVHLSMKKFGSPKYGNPSAIYTSGVMAKNALEDARTKVANILHAHVDEIIFTGSGTEANNLAIRGILEKISSEDLKGKHVIVSAIEHSSILETAKVLEKKGIKVSYIPVDKNGVVDLEFLKKEVSKETILISVMMVNNEIGIIEPIQEIAKIVRDFKKKNNSIYPILHTDACQAMYLPLYVEKLGVDMMTLDGHKIYGPRGIGMLYVKRGIELYKIISGGGQERGLRSGTENIPAIAGFATALEIVDATRDKEYKRLSDIKEYFEKGLLKINKNIVINPLSHLTSPHISNISIPDIDNEFFVLQLDVKGIECSTKSACLRDEDESYVLKAISVSSKNSVRFSFGRETTKKDLEYTLKIMSNQ